MCLYPKLIKNPKYKPNKKNGGRPPLCVDIRILYVPVACGKCMECMKAKANEWRVRMIEEIRGNKNGKFVTLTFSEEALNELSKIEIKEEIKENGIATVAVRRFLERWRKKYKKSVRHWLVTELGHTGTERIHLHGIIFTDEPDEIEKIWGYGMVWIGQYVNERTINYIVKYIHKIDKDHKGYQPKILTSSGMGRNYINRPDASKNEYKGKDTEEIYRTRTGLKMKLPIYYRNQLYTDDQKEELWIKKLEENVRYVGGEKIKVGEKHGMQHYFKTLKYYQRKNKELGYGDDSEKWSVEEYKKERAGKGIWKKEG